MARHLATIVCGWSGHVTPAADARSLDGPLLLGVDASREMSREGDAGRFCRCLRCDGWVWKPTPANPASERLPAPDELEVPKRGKALKDLIVVRLIAFERALHCIGFTLVAVLAAMLRADLTGVKSSVRRLLGQLESAQQGSSTGFNGSFVNHEGHKILALKKETLLVLFFIALVYAILEGTEAVGLWHEKRWAEYLTCIATAGFLPYEVYDLTKTVTALKIATLIINLLVLFYLIWAKGLFGTSRFKKRKPADVQPDPATLFGRPTLAGSAGSSGSES